jgi:putative transposase
MIDSNPNALPSRRKPASGVFIDLGCPTIVFVTVCTKDRQEWLVSTDAQNCIKDSWIKSSAWKVGYYLFMPNHVHFFCSPAVLDISLVKWVSFWKRLFSMSCGSSEWIWQPGCWDTRLRREESYRDKWEYVRQNPVRAGLVEHADDWQHSGMMNVLRW